MAKSYGSGSGEHIAYAVEARSTYTEPQTHCGMLLDNRWRRVEFMEGSPGVQINNYDPVSDHLRLMNYSAACALAAWFLAGYSWRDMSRHSSHGLCVEVRLVKVKVKYTYSSEEVGVGEPLNSHEAERAEIFTVREAESQPPTGKDGGSGRRTP